MSRVEVESEIAAPPEVVWGVLSDIGNIYRWNPVIARSRLTTAKSSGVGAARHCDFRGRGYIEERVTEWEEERRLGVEVTRSTLPLKEARIRFDVREENRGSVVRVHLEYTPKWGLLGRMLDRLYGRRAYRRTMQAVADGLKRHTEGIPEQHRERPDPP